jgi:hypothetical protein
MRLLMFVSALGILVSIAVLIMVLLKAKRDKEKEETPPRIRGLRDADN